LITAAGASPTPSVGTSQSSTGAIGASVKTQIGNRHTPRESPPHDVSVSDPRFYCPPEKRSKFR
jgi:hypothetical protein